MSSRTPVAVAVVVVRGCRVAIFRRFVPNVFGSVCPRSASWCGSSHIRLPSGAAAAAARAGFFVGEVSSVFFGGGSIKSAWDIRRDSHIGFRCCFPVFQGEKQLAPCS